LERAAEPGMLAALDDRARTGRDATITAEARTWLVGLACAKPTQYRGDYASFRLHRTPGSNRSVNGFARAGFRGSRSRP
jgi:hypothetical protein